MTRNGLRTFLALPLPRRIRAELALLQGGLRVGRPVDPEAMHLTLVFLGEVPHATLDELHLALEHLLVPPLQLRLRGMGAFGRDAPRSVWVGVEPNPALERLQAKLTRAARMVGVDLVSRRYVPHVTLARLAGRESDASEVAGFVAARTGFATSEFRADHVALVASHPARNGPNYELLARYPLA